MRGVPPALTSFLSRMLLAEAMAAGLSMLRKAALGPDRFGLAFWSACLLVALASAQRGSTHARAAKAVAIGGASFAVAAMVALAGVRFGSLFPVVFVAGGLHAATGARGREAILRFVGGAFVAALAAALVTNPDASGGWRWRGGPPLVEMCGSNPIHCALAAAGAFAILEAARVLGSSLEVLVRRDAEERPSLPSLP